ncbi:MAG: peptidase M28 family protein, partial [Acidobacteria bacterium]|nr:peptidase M28 family protein [Acidobacteriota bacterium]
MRISLPIALALTLAAGPLTAQDALPKETVQTIRELEAAALASPNAYELVRSLTDEVGPRHAGSPGDAAGVAWAVATLKRLGFSNVRAEKVMVPHWVRGAAEVALVSPGPERSLAAAALGGSVGTPEGGIEAEVVEATSL